MFHVRTVQALHVNHEVEAVLIIESHETRVGFNLAHWNAQDAGETNWSGIGETPETVPRPEKVRIRLDFDRLDLGSFLFFKEALIFLDL